MDSEIVIECPNCELQFTVPGEMRGDIGTCATCGCEVPVQPIGYKPNGAKKSRLVRFLRFLLGVLDDG